MKKVTKLALVLVIVSLVALGLLVSCPAIGSDTDETPEISTYEFVLDESVEMEALESLVAPASITIADDDGELNAPGEAAYSALADEILRDDEADLEPYLVNVTLKATTIGENGYDHVRIEALDVDYDGDGDLAVYLYANSDKKWYDLVQTGWGTTGVDGGFELSNDEDTSLEAYAFASVAGTYTVTFKAIDLANDDAEIVSGSIIIEVEALPT